MIRRNIPNMFTLGNLYCGFLSVGYATSGSVSTAAILILIGMMFDAMDGRIARMLRVESPLGKELDSLADIVTFGVAPSFLVYDLVFQSYGTVGLLIAGLFPLFGAFRLARFNVTPSETSKKYFTGVPITAAGGIVALLTLMNINELVMVAIFIALAFLMVSTVRIPSFKDVPLPKYGTIVTIFLGYILYLVWTTQRNNEPFFVYLAIVVYILYILNQYVLKRYIAKKYPDRKPRKRMFIRRKQKE
ncbi:MAG: CDP-diacylglycerol--serine O-phosphatidyltransferase [Bacilli bacterium]